MSWEDGYTPRVKMRLGSKVVVRVYLQGKYVAIGSKLRPLAHKCGTEGVQGRKRIAGASMLRLFSLEPPRRDIEHS